MPVPDFRRFSLSFRDIAVTLPVKSKFISEVGNFTLKYSDDQARDDTGRWSAEGGGSSTGDDASALSANELSGMQDWTSDLEEREDGESYAALVDRLTAETIPSGPDPDEELYIYHATFADKVPDIAKAGLLPGGLTGEHYWGGALGDESEGVVFFSASADDAAYYPKIVARNLFEQGERSVPSIVIVRTLRSALDGENLTRVQTEAQYRGSVQPAHLHVYYHGQWRPLASGGKSEKYSDDQSRDDSGRWTSEGGGSTSTSREERASASHVPMTKERRGIATKHENKVATTIGGTKSDDNKPFDIVKGRFAIEVKTIISGKHPKVTLHPESLARKEKEAKANNYKTSVVAIDARGASPVYYWKEGLGSFRLSSMTKVTSSELKAKYR